MKTNPNRQDRRPFINLHPIPDSGLTPEVLRLQLLHWIQAMPIAKAYDSPTVDTIINDATILIWDKMCQGNVPNAIICDYKRYSITVLKNLFRSLHKNRQLYKNKIHHQTIDLEQVFFDGEISDDSILEDKKELERQYNLLQIALSCLSTDRQNAVRQVLNGETAESKAGDSGFYFEAIKRDLRYIVARLIKGEKPDDIKKLTNYRPKKDIIHLYPLLKVKII